MKKTCRIQPMSGLGKLLLAMAILALGSPAFAADAPTLDFRQLNVSCNGGVVTTSLAGCTKLGLGGNLDVPTQTILVALESSQTLDDLSIATSGYQVVSQAPVVVERDLVTAANPGDYPSAVSAVARNQLGRSAVTVVDEVTIGGQRYARLLVCPVYLDSDNHLVKAGEISVNLDGHHVQSSSVLDYETTVASAQPPRTGASLSSGDIVYVIVTSDSLRSAFDRLAAYKTSLGIPTEVRLIENVLNEYTGRDNAERLRNALIDWHARGVNYVLLGGDETVLPVRYALHYATNTQPTLDELQLCDLYFADLTGAWDVDSDGVWGEPYQDQPDLVPEIDLGRLPFNTPGEVNAYIDKLLMYETNPGEGDGAYLDRAFFFSGDQMRDWGSNGQHGLIAAAYPDYFAIDTVDGVEQSSGYDENPTNLVPSQLMPILGSGYGIVNIISHGSGSGFVVRSSGYNDFPKAYFQTSLQGDSLALIDGLEPNHRTAFYYSLACSNGGFDRDQPPFNEPAPNLVQTFLAQPDAGAVGFVAYSRWGWISSSHFLQTALFDSLFAHPDRPAVEAMYASKAVYYYYRDLVYGQNYFGDPTMKVYTDVPARLNLALDVAANGLLVTATANNAPKAGCSVVISDSVGIVWEGTTNLDGTVWCDYPLSVGDEYSISAKANGCSAALSSYSPSIVSGVNDDTNTEPSLPVTFALAQNYPNPFNPSTVISFSVPERAHVTLEIYNVLGQLVDILADRDYSAGDYQIDWDGLTMSGNPASTGVYFYRLSSSTFTQTRKMLLIR